MARPIYNRLAMGTGVKGVVRRRGAPRRTRGMKRARVAEGLPAFFLRQKGDGIPFVSRGHVRLVRRAYVYFVCILMKERKKERKRAGVDAPENDRLIYVVGYILSE